MEETREAPTFEGRKVDGRELKLSGSLAQLAKLDDAHQIDDEIVVIGIYKLDQVTHKLTPKNGFLRVEGASAIELHVVTGSTDALTLLQQARETDQAAIDAILGRTPLPFADDSQVTDEGLHRLIDSETGEITDEQIEDRVRQAVEAETDDDYTERLQAGIDAPVEKPEEPAGDA